MKEVEAENVRVEDPSFPPAESILSIMSLQKRGLINEREYIRWQTHPWATNGTIDTYTCVIYYIHCGGKYWGRAVENYLYVRWPLLYMSYVQACQLILIMGYAGILLDMSNVDILIQNPYFIDQYFLKAPPISFYV